MGGVSNGARLVVRRVRDVDWTIETVCDDVGEAIVGCAAASFDLRLVESGRGGCGGDRNAIQISGDLGGENLVDLCECLPMVGDADVKSVRIPVGQSIH